LGNGEKKRPGEVRFGVSVITGMMVSKTILEVVGLPDAILV
jgi:hypothetical protein